MQTCDTREDLAAEHADDVPPPPIGFKMYVERELHARVCAAYERGLVRGSRHQIALFLTGVALGWLASFAMSR
jgi:hypothetical protein